MASSFDFSKKLPLSQDPTYFKLRAQLLSRGRTDTVLAQTDNMQLRLKVYASGGENTLHAHKSEDHSFVVLQGRARFYAKDGGATEIGRYEGIMIPGGAFYSFEAVSTEELVMLRMGASIPGNFKASRIAADGSPMLGDSKENHGDIQPVFKEGRFFE